MKLENITKSFNGKEIISNFTRDIPNGKITYIMGASGIGKTTLLRIIAGLDTDFSGNIEKSGKIAYVFQEPRLFPALTVKENVEIVGGTNDSKDILSTVELDGCENMMPNELSGGMKMRLSIARALYSDADIYLMDEPFSALDDETKNRIVPKIFAFLKGKTVIIVSHNVEEAALYADNTINL
ncbi:MAG: ATP-binding cassette domain-containing protein [Eubacteriales bacterium]